MVSERDSISTKTQVLTSRLMVVFVRGACVPSLADWLDCVIGVPEPTLPKRVWPTTPTENRERNTMILTIFFMHGKDIEKNGSVIRITKLRRDYLTSQTSPSTAKS